MRAVRSMPLTPAHDMHCAPATVGTLVSQFPVGAVL